MKEINENNVFVMVPKVVIDEIRDGINKLLKGNEPLSANGIGDYISEKEAQQLLGRKTTWFWSMRSKGYLSYTKVGNKVFYNRKDLEKYLTDHKKNAFR
ncbi:hypothetical protein GCM10009122_03060 [Fulvivirga kasyanovii]|uniref:DNA-binding protein n=1 Tax=Fulvivirga kasyanovii TaxID=396812 RepID=A0ABW9RJV9_9BACT|nr:helix-turn-helix domain-containing protein [Fulvivirga kasyanovii]MTI24367.1 DNA-binding protein [Fulvivirga kasyanovii]